MKLRYLFPIFAISFFPLLVDQDVVSGTLRAASPNTTLLHPMEFDFFDYDGNSTRQICLSVAAMCSGHQSVIGGDVIRRLNPRLQM